MWCLSVAGRMVVHQYLGGGSHLQPLLGWCLILLPPRHPCVMEEEQVLGFSGGVCFPLVCTPLHLASACVWQIHHRLCGFVICDQEPCVCGLGLFGHWHCWSCVLIDWPVLCISFPAEPGLHAFVIFKLCCVGVCLLHGEFPAIVWCTLYTMLLQLPV